MMHNFLLTSFLVAPADAALLRRTSIESSGDPNKWDKMDDFLETMFVIACKWKHGKDVNGVAAEKLKDGDIKPKELASFNAKTQSQNVAGVKRACGLIVAKGKKNCRQSCADRLGTMDSKVMEQRADCDKTCVKRYSEFEKSCNSKADNLKMLYDAKQKMAAAKKECYEGHCSKFPTVWMKDSGDMSSEVDTQCKKACTEDRVKVTCEHKFALEIDFTMAKIESACQADSDVSKCFSKEKESLSSDHESCASGGKTDCGGSFDKCKTDGKIDDTHKNAAEFCDERKKMCLEQVDEKCLKSHKGDLEKAKNECEKKDSGRQKKCVSEKTKEKEEKQVAACVEKKKPTCDEDCHASCNTDKMNTCLGNLGSTSELTSEFCTDFWQLLHESSEVDPETGNPIVLLSTSNNTH